MTGRITHTQGTVPSDRFAPKRLTEARTALRVGEFVFAGGMKNTVFIKPNGDLYYVSGVTEHPITLCKDGNVIIGKSSPMVIAPSLKDALKRM